MPSPCFNCEETPLPCIPQPTGCIGEECEEVMDSKCVEYTDPEVLENIGVNPGDRLNAIIKKWNTNQQTNTQAISTDDTNSVELDGSGVGSLPVKANLKRDPVTGNLIQITASGVKVVVDKAMITTILQLIISDLDLTALICEATKNCQPCGGSATGFTVTVT